jgi:hypothetical protein
MATNLRPDIRFPDPGTRTPSAPATETCAPACPACGGLECLCRPRFFAGQLLTDEDLRRLDRYIVEKNRLHNRHLHGSGVVCGLEVVCDACDSGNVRVRPGYALSPCGADIVVCKETSVPVCELVAQCREAARAPDCDPPRPGTTEDCREGVEKWVLAICYEESPSRAVAALRGDGGCGAGCACGGTGKGCSCGGGASKAASAGTSRRRTPQQCEPTLVCEGYRFRMYPAPKPALKRFDSDDPLAGLAAEAERLGPMFSRMYRCFVRMVEVRLTFHGQKYDSESALQTAYSAYLDAVRAFAAEHASHNCELLRTLESLETGRKVGFTKYVGMHALAQPDFSHAAQPDIPARVEVLDGIVVELWRECLCSALLPPCPGPEDRDCVPIATVTLRRGDCRVLEVCNWEAREFAITMPNLQYWTSFVQWGRIKEMFAKLCCVPARENANLDMVGNVFGKVAMARQHTLSASLREGTAFRATARAASGREAAADARKALALDFNPRDAELGPLLAVAYRAMFPDAIADWLMQVAGAPDKDAPAPAGGTELKALHERIAVLERRLASGPAAPNDAPRATKRVASAAKKRRK